jgi:hypothetical protein
MAGGQGRCADDPAEGAEPARRTTIQIMTEGPQFFYNVSTGQVEELANRGQSKDLLGPYPTREAAAAALETARAKTEAWDEEDRRWNDGDR